MTAVSIEVPPGESDPVAEPLRVEAASVQELLARLPEETEWHAECMTEGGGLLGCLACGHPELYRHQDFNRAVGVAIVVVAALLAPFTWYLSLVAAAILDAILYWVAPQALSCYVCSARHRGFGAEPLHPRFDREIDERLKYGDRAVMGKPMRAGGTAGAPEPEH